MYIKTMDKTEFPSQVFLSVGALLRWLIIRFLSCVLVVSSKNIPAEVFQGHYSEGGAAPWPSTSLGAKTYFQRSWHAGTDEGVDCATLRRVGPSGSGGKAICLDGGLDLRGLVVSVGVRDDWGFETALHGLCPTCPIEVFDGTNFGFGPVRPPAFVDFHDEDFTPETWRRFVGRRVEVLKIDCEGCEFLSLPPFVERLSPRLVLVEIHGNSHEDEADALLRKLNTTHGIYYREPNMEHSDGGCIEFALKRRGVAAPARASRLRGKQKEARHRHSTNIPRHQCWTNQREREQTCVVPTLAEIVRSNYQFDIAVYKTGDIVSNVVKENGEWEMDVYNLLKPFMSTSTIFVDVGANIGWHSLIFAREYQVVAFEPFESNLALLRASLCMSPELRRRVRVRPCGLSSVQQHCDLYQVADINYGDTHSACDDGAKMDLSRKGYRKLGSMDAYRLDDVIGNQLLNASKVIKIDVEGFEYEVLKGASDFFTQGRPPLAIFAEVNLIGANVQNFFELLQSWGYLTTAKPEDGAINALFVLQDRV